MSTTASSSPQAALSLPKGGGAVKGIGETFQANLFSGTADYSIPIALSPARGGLRATALTRLQLGKRQRGLRARLAAGDAARHAQDREGVAALRRWRCLRPDRGGGPGSIRHQGRRPRQRSSHVGAGGTDAGRDDHSVFRYRPRTEGLFARIERWVHTTTGETHWRTITKDNVTTVFGDTAATRVCRPERRPARLRVAHARDLRRVGEPHPVRVRR